MSALAAALYPLADSAGLWPSIISRFFTGFSQSSQLHFANEVVLRWAPKNESSLFFSILLASSQIGPLLTMILGGEMCSSKLGWEATYYILGGLTFINTIICVLLYTDKVEDSRFVSTEEKTLIMTGRVTPVNKAPVPYSSVVSDLSIWTSFILFTGYYVGMIVYQLYSPTFIKQVRIIRIAVCKLGKRTPRID
uniref:MFS domain-containing protein n=1 Tax=Heterorhabditis bacteriophora TaxID=37862 RepID=A0A1I7XLB6_HETBA